jgi:hypothetical protein
MYTVVSQVLKQTLTEESAALPVETKKAAPAPAKVAASAADSAAKSNSSSKPAVRRSEADGKWVKESLPPVSDK